MAKSDKSYMDNPIIQRDPEPEDRQFLYTDADIKEKLLAGDRIFGIPGASLTWGINGQRTAQTMIGGEGEKMVGKFLDEFVKTHPGTYVFHSVAWPGSNGDSDHLLVSGRNVWLIDAKRWKSKRKYSVTPKGAIMRGTVRFTEGKVKMIPAMAAWRKVFGKRMTVQGVVCIAQTEVFVPYDENWRKAPFRLVTIEKLGEYLESALKRQSEQAKQADAISLVRIARLVVKARDSSAFIRKDLF